MGICASCLGLQRRHPSHDDETDPLLDDQHAQYGSIGGEAVSQPDEEELRREREELDHITTEAADNMIDVLHPGYSDFSRRFAEHTHVRATPAEDVNESQAVEETEDDEDAAWLASLEATSDGSPMVIKGLDHSNLVFDPSQLRVDAPISAAKKSPKGNLPAREDGS